VEKTFGERAVLKGVDLEIRRGELVFLLGASGSGKTTILRIIASLEQATGGSVEVAHNHTTVFQEARLLPFRRVGSNVQLGLTKAERGALDLDQALTEVGLLDHIRAWPKSLSGGEAQRVALARALVRSPDLLLMDEPFGALDALTRIRMQDLVLELWQRDQPGVLFITHDVDEAIAMADRVLVLVDGVIAEDIPVEGNRPRDRSNPRYERLRERLLAELGVVHALV
jgi:sulfonate transport system ATP-binding protein